MSQLIRKQIGKDIHINFIRDDKFKFARASVLFLVPLKKQTASGFALLPHILRLGGGEYEDLRALNLRLDELYGASLDTDVKRFGETQVLSLSVSTLSDRFTLNGDAAFTDAAELLISLILAPHIENGAFPEKQVETAKANLIEQIEAEINDKRSYAVKQLIGAMCKDENYSVNKLGEPETVSALTPADAAACYYGLLKCAHIEIMLCGNFEQEPAARLFEKTFGGVKPRDTAPLSDHVKLSADTVRRVNEQLDVKQGKLCLGFRSTVSSGHNLGDAMRVMLAMYGALPTSKLFMNVREKLSLCYYCASRYDRQKGIVIVDSGVERENAHRAEQEILKQLEDMKNGAFTAEELKDAKTALKNAFYGVPDSISRLENWYFGCIYDGEQTSPSDMADRIEAVTAEQVVQAARSLSLDTVYLLSGKEEQ